MAGRCRSSSLRNVSISSIETGSISARKGEPLISKTIEEITKIDMIVLALPSAIKLASVAKKMSWAARRKTRRVEDRAYSLMGLFGVYMAPIYGEGAHAFIRLQEAILRSSTDRSIFAWTAPPRSLSEGLDHVSTMLALSPDQFEASYNFKPLAQNDNSAQDVSRFDYNLTNVGLSIRLPLLKIKEFDGLYVVFLACAEGDSGHPSAILLRATSSQTPDCHFWRTNSNEGPVERGARSWLFYEGRKDVATRDIYVMPRFTSVSKDAIEPTWKKKLPTPESTSLTGRVHATMYKPTLTLHKEILERLQHVPDPWHGQLTTLQKIRHLVMSNRPNQLLQLMKERPRVPRSLPPRNPRFIGRATHMKTLQGMLNLSISQNGHKDQLPLDRQRLAQSCVISGLTGIGKTQLALELSYIVQASQAIDFVFWINARSRDAVLESYKRFATGLKLVGEDASDSTVVREFIYWLSERSEAHWTEGLESARSRTWLLIFDDADEADTLRDFWPAEGPGAILVTSRNPTLWSGYFAPTLVNLEPLSVEEGSELLRTMSGSDEDFSILSNTLGGLPFILAQVGSLMGRMGLSVEEYLRRMNEVAQRSGPFATTTGIVASTTIRNTTLWDIPVLSTALASLSTSSKAMLNVMSFLDPDCIPDSIMAPLSQPFLKHYPTNIFNFTDGRGGLIRRSLIQRSIAPHKVTVHRLVQSVMVSNMEPDIASSAMATATTLVHSAWQLQNDSSRPSLTLDALLSNIRALATHEAKLGNSEELSDVRRKLSELVAFSETAGSLAS